MEKIGVLGGSFNPVHNEHVNIAINAIKELGLDKLIIMPTFVPPHKNTVLAPPDHRLNMLKKAFFGIDKVEISDYEIQKGGTSYTYLTLTHLKVTLSCELYFIFGEDLLGGFNTWRHPEEITKLANIAVFRRENYSEDFDKIQQDFIKAYGKPFIKLNYLGKSVSSTAIRVFAMLGLPLEKFVNKSVEEYIYQNKVFQSENLSVYVDFAKGLLPEKRLIHTASVISCALIKAEELGLDKDDVFLAGLLHDVAKYVDYKTVKGFTKPLDMPEPVVHAFLGEYMARNILGIKNEEVLDAIKYHTSGKPEMSKLAKLIFVADMVEEGRTYDGVEELRRYYKTKSLDECFIECLKEETIHLKNKKQPVYQLTLDAFNYYVTGKGE